MRKTGLIFLYIITFAILVGCNKKNIIQDNREIIDNGKSEFTYEFGTQNYKSKKIEIKYPQIINSNDANKQGQINDLIKNYILDMHKKHVNELIDNDMFKNFEEVEDALTKETKYEIMYKSPKLLSIAYDEYTNLEMSAHPYRNIFTTNIDIEKGTILKFKDLIDVDNNFVDKLKDTENRVWIPKSDLDFEGMEQELVRIISDNMNYTENQFYIDKIFSKDDYGYYFTKDYLNLSTFVPHVAGDYATLQIKYGDIKNFAKLENEIWNEFFK